MKRSKKLNIKPDWDEIEKARNASIQFLKDQGLLEDRVHALTMILSELIENGIKYGNFQHPEDMVEAGITIEDGMITIEVSHPVDKTAYRYLRELDKMIQWIRGFQDPFEAYIEKLREVAKKPLKDETSGLGLIRIAYEGGGILDFILNEDNRLSVSAVSNY